MTKFVALARRSIKKGTVIRMRAPVLHDTAEAALRGQETRYTRAYEVEVGTGTITIIRKAK